MKRKEKKLYKKLYTDRLLKNEWKNCMENQFNLNINEKINIKSHLNSQPITWNFEKKLLDYISFYFGWNVGTDYESIKFYPLIKGKKRSTPKSNTIWGKWEKEREDAEWEKFVSMNND